MLTKEEFEKLPKEERDAILRTAAEVQEALKKDAEKDTPLKKMTMPEFENMIKGTIEKLVKPMTSVDRKFFMFPGIGNKDTDDNTGEGKFKKTIKFLGALVKGDLETVKTLDQEVRQKANLNESAGTEGAFLVPEEFKAEILRLAPVYGVVRRECRIIPMLYDVVNIPAAGTTDITAHWTNEGSQIYTTNPNFRQVTLTINKLASIPKVTPELLADANVNVIQYLAELIAEQFAKAEDTQGFIGVGSPFVGVMNATGVPTAPHASGTGFAALSYGDLVKTPANLYPAALANAKFYFHRSMIGHIHSLITTTGAPIFGGVAKEVVGYPLVSVEILPGLNHTAYQTDATTYAVFGDLRKGLILGERGVITMKIATEGTVLGDNLFEKDMIAMRMIERVCFGVALPSAFCVINS